MKLMLRGIVAAVAALALAHATAMAETQSATETGTQPGMSPATTTQGQGQMQHGKQASGFSGKLVRANQVLGSDIYDAQGQDVGEINSLIVDQNGQITHAVLAAGGFLGIGEKLTPVPWQSISRDDRDRFTLQIDKSKLQAGPSFERGSFPELNRETVSSVNRHYGMEARTEPTGQLVKIDSTMIGGKVFDQKGQEIGRIDNVLLDPMMGRVAYAILDVGTYLGLGGDQRTPVPFNLVRYSMEAEKTGFVLQADRQKLVDAPHFAQNSWPDFSTAEINQRIYSHFGVEPYWKPEAIGEAPLRETMPRQEEKSVPESSPAR